ncbi:response regulator [Mucilaginibacter polytrichastri]|uniref:response regulator n=1 Tax=Mucilaginibacter polytrichastri TaxID=1302689 RepID=UPI0008EF2DE8|nr:response regulator [Mucilaginibacter polytrichastri]SFS82917.1 Response regulator receiver domain-containing protein [Mucilaginibacter polytrichastri]
MAKRILILDDDQQILDVVSFLLIDSGYDVQTLDSGEQIFSIIEQFHPDLVLMDVMLANMDGRVICKDLKEFEGTNGIPIILISGTHDLAESLHQIGAPNDFLSKPFDIDVLLSKIIDQLK